MIYINPLIGHIVPELSAHESLITSVISDIATGNN